MNHEKRKNIMVVDDEPDNLKLLEGMLRRKGYDVRVFPRGRLALAAAAQQPPDLILLDVTMPELTGYEVCERFKANAILSAIPVIFLSALPDAEDKVKGFLCGGVDYMSKPLQFDEVYARIETHLKLYELQRTLRLHNDQLEEKVATRTRELADENRRLTILDRAKNEFLNLISHEFRTPLNGLLGVSDILLEGMTATVENVELHEMFERSRQRILSILDDALLFTQIDINGEQFTSGLVSLSRALSRAVDSTVEFAASRHVTLTRPFADLNFVAGDEELLVRALHALFETAVKFSEDGETIGLTLEFVPESRRVIIDSCGRTIPPPVLPKFFDVLSIGEAITPGGDLGLGPALAHRILALFGASVTVANRHPSGIRLTITLKDIQHPVA
jgi:two-component system sensor histidine kinase/response regulator